MMWQNHWTVIERLEKELAQTRQELKEERERNRIREEALIDRIMVRNNSRPLAPPEPMEAPPQPMSPLDIARMRDRLQEEFEHRGMLPQDATPDVRIQLEAMLDDMAQGRL